MTEDQEAETKEAPPVAASDASENGPDTHRITAPVESVNPFARCGTTLTAYEAAELYRQAGFAPIKVIAGGKKAAEEWKPYQAAPPSLEVIEGWFGENGNPFANVALVTGSAYGFAVVDVDTAKGGDAFPWFLTSDVFQRTPRGLQFFFSVEPGDDVRCAVGVLPGVDVRGEGGYVCVPPSKRPEGVYRWESGNADRPDAMSMLLARKLPRWKDTAGPLLKALRVQHGMEEKPSASAPSEEAEVWVARTLEAGCPAGTRNDTLARLAGYFAGRGIPEDVAASVLVPWVLRQEGTGVTLQEAHRTIESIYTKERSARQHADRGALPALVFRDLCDVAEEQEAAMDWTWRGYLAPGILTVLSGKPKAGKSTIVFSLLRVLQDGGDFLGQPAKQARVIYLAEESSRSLKQKIARFGIEPGNIRALTRREAFPRRPMRDVIEAAVQEARTFGAAVLIVDTITFWAGLEQDQEQDAGVMNELAGILQKAAAEGGVGVLALHHDRKGDAVGLDAMRGSSAFAASADLILQLRAPGEGRERELRGWGRYEETPSGLLVTFTREGGYGLMGVIEEGTTPEAREREVVAALPDEPPGLTAEEVAKKAGRDRHTVKRILDGSALVLSTGKGKGRDPKRYYRNGPAVEVVAAASGAPQGVLGQAV